MYLVWTIIVLFISTGFIPIVYSCVIRQFGLNIGSYLIPFLALSIIDAKTLIQILFRLFNLEESQTWFNLSFSVLTCFSLIICENMQTKNFQISRHYYFQKFFHKQKQIPRNNPKYRIPFKIKKKLNKYIYERKKEFSF